MILMLPKALFAHLSFVLLLFLLLLLYLMASGILHTLISISSVAFPSYVDRYPQSTSRTHSAVTVGVDTVILMALNSVVRMMSMLSWISKCKATEFWKLIGSITR